jgi:hypothetical protein
MLIFLFNADLGPVLSSAPTSGLKSFPPDGMLSTRICRASASKQYQARSPRYLINNAQTGIPGPNDKRPANFGGDGPLQATMLAAH